MQWAKHIWHFQNCATWSHTCTLALSGFGGILVLFQIAAQTGASVTCWWPDWHVWHKIRARGDNVVFGLGWASWVRRFIYMLNERQCSKGRVHIGFCTKQCLGSGGANPPWLPIVAPPIGAFTRQCIAYIHYALGCPPPPSGLSRFCAICSSQVSPLCQIWTACLPEYQGLSTLWIQQKWNTWSVALPLITLKPLLYNKLIKGFTTSS